MPTTRTTFSDHARRAFTIIELMTVIVIIAVLMTVLLFAVGKVRRATENVGVERQLAAISNALEQFKTDLQFYPPLLAADDASWRIGDAVPVGKKLIVPEALPDSSDPRERLRQARYASEYTLAAYLLGSGDINGRVGDSSSMASSATNAGANNDHDDGNAGPGIRAPGPDRSWGGAADREKNNPTKTGRVYGPYLEQSTLTDQLVLDPVTGMFKITDPWGQPIRYYTNWPITDTSPERVRSVGRIPVELRSAASVQAQIDAVGVPDMELDRQLFTAPYMLLSAGRPVEFTSDGSPKAIYGDRKIDESLLQNLTVDFNPSLLSEDERDYLISALESNIRGTR